MSRPIDADAVKGLIRSGISVDTYADQDYVCELVDDIPTIDAVSVVRCKDCKHRPIKEDQNGDNYGFNLIKPTNGDERCPCLVEDGWYSWMPEDDFYCGYGERKGE